MTLENIQMRRSQAIEQPLFFYCFPAKDPYFASVIGRSIKYGLKHFPKSQHIVYPIYGCTHYSTLRSKKKIPRWIKYIQFQLDSIKKQYLHSKDCRESLKNLIGHEEVNNVEYIPFISYLASLMFYLIKYLAFSVPTINKYRDNQEFSNSFNLTFIPAGDLIIDTYIRFKGEAAANSNHWFFKDVVLKAFAIEKVLAPYFKRAKKVFYFGSYSTYTYHGISLRLACKNPNNVAITFGSIPKTYIIHKNLEEYILPSHAGYHQHYSREQAKNLDTKVISNAETSLQRRLKGKYDSSMSYMLKTEACIPTGNIQTSANEKCHLILMLHDFFDSPHIYQWLLFPDFWCWAYETILFCAKNNIEVHVKPHPNQLPENNLIISELKTKFAYSDCVKWIPQSTKNVDLFKSNPKAIISAYGSVAAEAAYLEIPVLMAGDHPGINFSIAKVANTKEEYFSLILQPSNIPKGSKVDAILFTALHHKNTFDGKKCLMQKLQTTLKDIDNNPNVLFTAASTKRIDIAVNRLFDEIVVEI